MGDDALVPRIWELRENLSAYDAAYVALAEAIADEGAPLITADDRLARALGSHTRIRVIVARRAAQPCSSTSIRTTSPSRSS